MKKILAMLLAVMMLLSVASVAMAETTTIATDAFKKVYNLTNPGTSSPEERFAFTLTCTGVTDAKEGITKNDAPTLTATIDPMTAGNGNTENISLSANKPFPSIGWYTYTITETAGTTAGVTYDTTVRTLKVLVVNDGENSLKIESVGAVKNSNNMKDDTFTNVYSAGTLSIEKQVTGNLGDKDKYFTVTVTLTGENGKTYGASYAVTGGSYTDNPQTIEIGKETTFMLKHGDTISIANLPYGVTYSVVEIDYTGDKGGYDAATYTGDTGENAKIDGATQNVTITNNKGGTIDTGVMLDSMPYVLVLAVVGAAVIALIAKKRRAED